MLLPEGVPSASHLRCMLRAPVCCGFRRLGPASGRLLLCVVCTLRCCYIGGPSVFLLSAAFPLGGCCFGSEGVAASRFLRSVPLA